MSMLRKIRVLVVDDSAFMRKALERMLSSDPMIKVVDTASDGLEGYEKTMALRPDVVTLDVRMPGMDGLTALGKIMSDCPTPVLMLSSLTSEGGEVTLKALDIGAVDFIDKSSARSAMDILSIAGELIMKVKAIAGVDVAKVVKKEEAGVEAVTLPPSLPMVKGRFDAVAIGTSTGGPPALQLILTAMPSDLPVPILVVQHMPMGFTSSLAKRLDGLTKLDVAEAGDGDLALPGRCLIAPSGLHMYLEDGPRGLAVRLSKSPDGLLHRPSVDILMESVAEILGRRAVGVILTGMGSDGAKGIKAIHDSGGRTIAQDESTCVVYGMPKVAVELGGVDRSLPLERIPAAIIGELGVVG
jgi:two-component system, chemotaxis family, protein-glutamate methylesterase/glutaminase